MRESRSTVERRTFQAPFGSLHHHGRPRLVVFYVLLCLSCCCCFLDMGCKAQKLVQSEVDTLRLIGDKLKMDWNFSVDPCSPDSGWIQPQGSNTLVTNNVNCTCNNDANGSTVCHITSILLKGMNLTGGLPEEFANLTFLSILDLTRNYLTGSIPTKWASLPLTQLTLLGNQISGSIPKELGSISTLESLVLEDNLLQGSIPPELGQLANLSRLFLSANNLSGELPESLGNLKNLTDFRIDGNPISGKIPSFIGNWTQLNRLDMQGTSMEGPFPPIFSTLTAITQLRVSDWKGGDGKFPAVGIMTNMIELVLRNMSISGELPDFIGSMNKLKNLDLSFNNLSGAIPNSYSALSKTIDFMYLTSNNLSGNIPSWILSSKGSIDVSYNSFTGSPAPSTCTQGSVNLASSYSLTDSNSVATCLRRNLPCAGEAKNFKLFINCGGGKVTIGDDTYQDDTSPLGASTYSDRGFWAYSNTGDFVGNENAPYIVNNVSVLNMTNPELYMTARLSALSLKYYGFCLQKGNYTVKLHFAEIIFDDNQTFSSTGRRLFDVSIQGKKVLHDFNIVKEANGTGKALTKSFTTLVDETLEIHFQWAGKGTNSIPQRGTYGPLVSAISVTPNFHPKLDNNKLSAGAITGIVVGSCFFLVLALAALWFFFIRKDPQNDEFKGLELHTGSFTLRQIKTATKHFDPENKIGEGGFGPVYKGVLPDGTVIAVKQLSSKSKQGNREFINEIGMISALQHPNLMKLYGCCIEGNQLLLIYEYMENNSLARALFGPEGQRLKLDWGTRRKICLGIARGLAYLHEESRIKIVHRDIKATNVLLDKDLNAKISDFGLAKLDEEENTHISTRVAGTIGYMAPEYAMRGYLTDKADVYSFGVVTMEIVSGVSNTNYRPKEEFVYLLDWAYVLQEQGNLLELVDKNLGSHYSKEEAFQMLNLALLCTNPSPTLRPTMSTVVSMLEGKTPVRMPTVVSGTSRGDDKRFRAFQKLSQENQMQTGSVDGDGPWMDSSLSVNTSGDENNSHAFNNKTTSDFTD